MRAAGKAQQVAASPLSWLMRRVAVATRVGAANNNTNLCEGVIRCMVGRVPAWCKEVWAPSVWDAAVGAAERGHLKLCVALLSTHPPHRIGLDHIPHSEMEWVEEGEFGELMDARSRARQVLQGLFISSVGIAALAAIDRWDAAAFTTLMALGGFTEDERVLLMDSLLPHACLSWDEHHARRQAPDPQCIITDLVRALPYAFPARVCPVINLIVGDTWHSEAVCRHCVHMFIDRYPPSRADEGLPLPASYSILIVAFMGALSRAPRRSAGAGAGGGAGGVPAIGLMPWLLIAMRDIMGEEVAAPMAVAGLAQAGAAGNAGNVQALLHYLRIAVELEAVTEECVTEGCMAAASNAAALAYGSKRVGQGGAHHAGALNWRRNQLQALSEDLTEWRLGQVAGQAQVSPAPADWAAAEAGACKACDAALEWVSEGFKTCSREPVRTQLLGLLEEALTLCHVGMVQVRG